MEKYHTNKTVRDDEYIRAYLETHSQIKAAQKCGVGRETVARAVRRAGIKLDGRNHNGYHEGNYGGGYPIKITNEQLVQEVFNNPNAQIIAEKYNMSIEQVCKRCSKLGLKVNGSSRKWKQRAKFYGCNEIDPTITLDRLRQRDNDICQICGEVVDILDRTDKHIGARYPSCDHIIPLSKGGAHTWNNVQLAHMGCNSGKCNRITVKREGV